MADNPSVLSNFNFQTETFKDTLRAELIDALNFRTSGILIDGSSFVDRSAKGQFVDIPQYQTLIDKLTQVVSGVTKDTNNFADYKMRAVWVQREGAWSVESLVQNISGKDILTEIARQLANIVARTIQDTSISVLKGVFATALAGTHSTGTQYSGATIDGSGILAAKQLLGDVQSQLTRMITHSKILSDAVALQIAKFPNTLGTDAARSGEVSQLYGMNAWMDDAITAVSSIYSSYISAPGQLLYVLGDWNRRDLNGNPVTSNGPDIEYSRVPNIGGGQDRIYLRMKYLVQLNGMQYNSATANPTDTQLATGANWTKVVDDDKKIKITELKTL